MRDLSAVVGLIHRKFLHGQQAGTRFEHAARASHGI